MEDSTHFEFTVSSRIHAGAAFPPFTAELTYAEVVRRKIRLETRTISLPEQTFFHQNTNDFIPLYTPNDAVFVTHIGTTVTYSLNCAGISQIMTHHGGYGYSTIFREIYEAVTSTRFGGREVTQVKILKITNKVYEVDQESENLLMEKHFSDSLPFFEFDTNNNPNGSTECVICLNKYKEGSIVVKFPCGHYFHGVCINKWWQKQHICPLCRIPISNSSPFSFLFWIFV